MTLRQLIKLWMAALDGLRTTDAGKKWEAIRLRCTWLRQVIKAAAERGLAHEDDVEELFQQVTGVTLEEAGLA